MRSTSDGKKTISITALYDSQLAQAEKSDYASPSSLTLESSKSSILAKYAKTNDLASLVSDEMIIYVSKIPVMNLNCNFPFVKDNSNNCNLNIVSADFLDLDNFTADLSKDELTESFNVTPLDMSQESILENDINYFKRTLSVPFHFDSSGLRSAVLNMDYSIQDTDKVFSASSNSVKIDVLNNAGELSLVNQPSASLSYSQTDLIDGTTYNCVLSTAESDQAPITSLVSNFAKPSAGIYSTAFTETSSSNQDVAGLIITSKTSEF